MSVFLVNFILYYLRFFARKALQKHQPIIIGIAGSVGKSSTRNAIEAIFKDYFSVKSVGNSETGIPLGILGMKPQNYTKLEWLKLLLRAPLSLNYLKGTKYLIAEMGIDDPYPPKNMKYLLTILKPDIAISLNVSATHTMQFEKALSPKDKQLNDEEKLKKVIQKIAEEDTKILTESSCKIGIYNADDEALVDAIQKKRKKILSTEIFTFGKRKTNDIFYGEYNISLSGTKLSLYVKDIRGKKLQHFKLYFTNMILPKEYQEVFAAAVLAAIQTGLTLSQIKNSLERNFTLPKGRSSIFKGIHNSVIIDSTYNASRRAVEAFLDLVDTLKKATDRPVVFLFGDMRELGDEAYLEHRAVAEKIVGIVDNLYLVGPLTREYVLPNIKRAKNELHEVRWFDTSIKAGEYMKKHLPHNAIVLAKGSQNTIFLEEAIKMILADKKDTKNLCRQDQYWSNVKKNFFASHKNILS